MGSSVEYTALHCISNFSFLRGASHPEELVATAAKLGYQAIAVTDECSMSGIVRAHLAAEKYQIKLIVGSEFILEDQLHCVLLATDRTAYGKICQLITRARLDEDKGHYRLSRSVIETLDLSSCLAIWKPRIQIDPTELLWLKKQAHCWIAVDYHFHGFDKEHGQQITHMSHQFETPLVACPTIKMHRAERQPVLDTLTAIRLNQPIHQLGYALSLNAESHLRSLPHLKKIYGADLLHQTQLINERCHFSLNELRYEYPQELVPKTDTPSSHLRQLTFTGAQLRWPEGVPKQIEQSIHQELKLIQDMQYEPFFLTVYDVVKFARERGILCQGRGSSANSIVCYCLGITEVNPKNVQLLFERFISKERNEPPDIDVDFEHQRREEVIQYIYQKYGRQRAALAATVVRYRSKSALRDVGKAFGLDATQLQLLSKSVHRFNAHLSLEEKVKQSQLDLTSPQLQQMITLANQLIGFPRHLSQHVGGFVIAAEQMSDLVPIENARMNDRTLIQWDKEDLESLGILKVDVLALGMLTAIRKAFEYIQHAEGRMLTMARILGEYGADPDVYAMIQRADTIGVFQIESRAQMSMLPRLRPENYYDLVIQIAIVRPGPIQGDMVHPYLRRRQGKEPVHYPDQRIQSILERTLGVPIFQEQVMRIVMSAAGFSAGEADHIRRSMASWNQPGQLEIFEQKLKQGMQQNGYSDTFAEQIFRQILGFGEYGFPESHSASFALLAYVSAWLKYHYPAAFTCALLNSQPMGFYQPAQLVQDAQRHGVIVLPIDVTQSHYHASLVCDHHEDWQLRLGLNQVKDLSQDTAERITRARAQRNFTDIQDLATRAQLNQAELEALAMSDSLYTLAGHRAKSFWAISGVEKPMPLLPQPKFTEATPLLNKAPPLEQVKWDYHSTSMSLREHPLTFIRKKLDKMDMRHSQQLWQQPNGSEATTAGIIICRQRPKTSSGTTFLTLEDEFGISNIIVWGKLCETHYSVLLSAQLLLVRGKVQLEDNVLNLIASQLINGNHLLTDITLPSRDFH